MAEIEALAQREMRRLRSCVEQWPECVDGEYNPACCRFPKSCSCMAFVGEVPDELLEPPISSGLFAREDVIVTPVPFAEAAPEGGIEVLCPPAGAGRRGRVLKRDWAKVAEWLVARRNPERWLFFTNVTAGGVEDVKRDYPYLQVLAQEYRMVETMTGARRRTCDIYIRWRGEGT